MGRSRRLLQTYQVVADPRESGEPHSPLPEQPTPPNSIDKMGIQNQPFDSSMGLTILVLLTALFFMGFFSIYIRRFADESPHELSRRTRRRSGEFTSTSRSSNNNNLSPRLCTRKGLDFGSIQSLPVLRYERWKFVTKKKHPIVVDCAVCLAEFEEGESVKKLPFCQHLFHPECIDTWLVARASCPVCRASRIFKEEEEGVVVEMTEAAGGDGGARRCCSWSEIVVEEAQEGSEGRGGLQRTRSF